MIFKSRDHGILSGLIVLLILAASITGCQSSAPRKSSNTPGGFYGGDRPPSTVPANIASIPDAKPVVLPLSKTGNKPYTALGNRYHPLKSAKNYRARGTASWYGKKFHGRRTSSGEPYDMFAMTAAHTILPLPSFARVTNLDNNRSVVVKINDRGPFLHNRIIDLSYAAATKLGITAAGTGRVEVVALDPRQQQVEDNQQLTTAPITGIAGTTARQSPEVSQYLLQLGAFASLDNALNLRVRIQQAGYRVVPGSADELVKLGSPYRVLAGPFNGQLSAEEARSRLEKLMRQPVVLKQI